MPSKPFVLERNVRPGAAVITKPAAPVVGPKPGTEKGESAVSTDSLKFTTQQITEAGEVLSSTNLEYPSMPNEMANLFNVTATLSLCLVALRAGIFKAQLKGGDPLTIGGMVELAEGLNALINSPMKK